MGSSCRNDAHEEMREIAKVAMEELEKRNAKTRFEAEGFNLRWRGRMKCDANLFNLRSDFSFQLVKLNVRCRL